MADFYAARRGLIPPLPRPTFSHTKFAGSPEVVRLLGAGLNSAGRFGQASGPGLDELLASAPIRVLAD